MEIRGVFEGVLDGLPPRDSRTVRVFFSSTFTDMSAERNKLTKEAVPDLRNYCLGKGLDFQVVDMRWGVRDEASADQLTSDLCLKEISNCQTISTGPNFVVFLGDRYGTCPLPATIPVKDFQTFHRVAMAIEKDIYELDKWYLMDTNAVPAVYQLQPITNLLPHYNDPDPANHSLREKDQARWEAAETSLKTLIHQLTREALTQGELNQPSFDDYFMSVTEREVGRGILEVSDTGSHVACFHRTLQNIDTNDSKAWRFTDLTDENEIDLEVKDRREKLTQSKIPKVVSSNNIYHYSIEWRENGVNPDDPSHAQYLQSFNSDFFQCMKKMIDDSVSSRISTADDDLFSEILHHLYFSNIKSSNFFGREEEIKEIKEKLTNKSLKSEKEYVETKHSEQWHQEMDNVERNLEMIQQAAKEREDSENPYLREMIQQEAEETYSDSEDEVEMSERDDKLIAMRDNRNSMGVKFHLGDAQDDDESDPSKNPYLREIEIEEDMSVFKRPLIIHGESGSGKTALMAKLAQLSKSWFPNSALIVRFLGTSPQSTSIREVLLNICKQIWRIYDVQRPSGIDLTSDFQYLVSYFLALLWKIDTSTKPLVIVFDSVDQLSSSDNAHLLLWLPTKLPQNVHILVSLLPRIGNCLENAQKHIPAKEQFVQVQPFSESAGAKMVSTLCSNNGRTLTVLQKNLVMKQFSQCPQPLYLKLMVDQAITWKSFTPVCDIQIGNSTRAAINSLFDKMERNHGFVLISKAFGYLSASCQGLSDTEMEDLLSLDDDVLQDTYLYHLPPDPSIIRLPPLLWKRVRGDISEYLAERQSGNMVVVSWYHRQFSEVAKERYLAPSVTKGIHKALTEYFSGKWNLIEKPLELFKVKKGSFPNAMRQVPSQPLRYENDRYNIRKLQELPYHLVQSEDFEAFHDTVACSFELIFAMCKLFSVAEVVSDLQMAISGMNQAEGADWKQIYEDVKFVHSMLLLGTDSIRKDADNLPFQIVSQLSPGYSGSKGLEGLVQEANVWLKGPSRPLLVPQGKCMPSPGGCLLTSVSVNVNILGNDRVFGSCMQLNEKKGQLYVTEQQDRDKGDNLRVYDLENSLSCMSVESFNDKIRSLRFINGTRLILLEVFKESSSYSFTSYFELCDGSLSAPYELGCQPDTLAVSHSGRRVAFAHKGTVGIGELKDSRVMVEHVIESPTCHVQFAHDDRYLVTYSTKSTAIYDTETWKPVFESKAKEGMFDFHDGSRDFSRKVFFTKSNKFIHPGFGYEDGRNIYVTLIPSGETISKFEGGEHYDRDLCHLDAQEEFLIAGNTSTSYTNGDNDKVACLFNLERGELVSRLESTNGPYQDLMVFGEENLWVLLALWKDPVIYLVSVGTRLNPLPKGMLVRSVRDHSQAILQYSVSSDHTQMFSASADNTIKLWDLPRLLSEAKESMEVKATETEDTEKEEEDLQANVEDVGQSANFVFSKNSHDLFIVSKTGIVMKRDIEKGTTQVLLKDNVKAMREARILCLSSSGKHLAISYRNKVLVLDAQTCESVYNLTHVTRNISCLEEGGNVLFAATADMEAKGRLWSLDTGEVIRDVTFLYSFYATAVNHSGTKLIATMFDYPFILNVHQDEEEDGAMMNQQPDTMMSACCGASFSPDDRFAVACSGDGSIRVMEADTNRYMYNMRQRSSITNQTFSPDSKHYLTSGYRSIYVWTMTDGSLVCKLTRHQDFIVGLKFFLDGKFLLTSSRDKSIVIWDFEKRVSICSFLAHCEVNAVSVTPDGMTVVYAPENVDIVAELKPNLTLSQMLSGTYRKEVPHSVKQAQALAFGFSSQKIQRQASSRACVIL